MSEQGSRFEDFSDKELKELASNRDFLLDLGPS
jgi:hypothetical protein